MGEHRASPCSCCHFFLTVVCKNHVWAFFGLYTAATRAQAQVLWRTRSCACVLRYACPSSLDFPRSCASSFFLRQSFGRQTQSCFGAQMHVVPQRCLVYSQASQETTRSPEI